MKYKSFHIENFKGIKDTRVELDGIAGASVFAFVGLNESGKTTVLEAIHSFAPDEATSELLGGEEGLGVPFKERVPRHLISEFTGYVSVTAKLSVSTSDKDFIRRRLLDEHGLEIDVSEFPDEISMRRRQQFENGDFKNNYFNLIDDIPVKIKSQRKWREADDNEKIDIRNAIYSIVPRIAYFPTFVFDFPEYIFLTDRGGLVDKFYRRVFQDILDYDGRGHTIDKDIVRRVQKPEMVMPWLSFMTSWIKNDDRDKIQHVMDRASAAVTRLVFGRWNKIFGEDTRGKEVVISYDVTEGEKIDSNGRRYSTQEHDIFVKFQIRDGTRRFNVNDRSLGFRWFFSFMLFTQFRVARTAPASSPLLFLFDEPASNLHAAAQQKLIESFPEIARDDHVLAYSTHSHYMIEPKWLEQTFIVTNRADDPSTSVLDEISLDDESLDVKVSTYRSFVNSHPNQTSYFQPILDRLDVVPSKFDTKRASVVLEGKSDYYILRYAQKLLGFDMPLLPGLGAGTFGALAALHSGWNLDFLFLLDGDKQGKKERDRYAEDFGILEKDIATIDELHKDVKVIEDVLDEVALKYISNSISIKSTPTKAQIRRFFQEKLASDQIKEISKEFANRSLFILTEIKSRLDEK